VASIEEEILERPVFLSTVTPGKLPTCCFNPVNALNSELFPLLGLPTNAMLMGFDKFQVPARFPEAGNAQFTKMINKIVSLSLPKAGRRQITIDEPVSTN